MTTTATTDNKAVDPLKIVNIILPKTNENAADNVSSERDTRSSSASNNASSSSPATSTSSSSGYVPPRATKSDEVLFAEPTFSEKFFRYIVVVIYLGGLSSLGFILSIYYLFFWDSRMPPVFKPTKKPPVFMKP